LGDKKKRLNHSCYMNQREEIRGRKVVIRPLTRSTLEEVTSWPEYTGLYSCYNIQEFETQEKRDEWYARRVETDLSASWFSIHSLDDRLIGLLNFYAQQNALWHREAEIGIGIRADECNKGYGAEAITAFVDYIFSETGLTHIGLGARIWNKRALRCYEKCGFTRCGESTMKLNGKNVQFIEMELTKERFLILRREKHEEV